jgi:hypothetical protein
MSIKSGKSKDEESLGRTGKSKETAFMKIERGMHVL